MRLADMTIEQRAAFYADMDSSTQIDIRGINFAQGEDEALAAVLARVQRHLNDGVKAVLTLSSRGGCHPGDPAEWLEWGVHITYGSGSTFFMVMIQRAKGADYEFHS